MANHSQHDDQHAHAPASGILAVLVISFAPVLLTLGWVIYLSTGGR